MYYNKPGMIYLGMFNYHFGEYWSVLHNLEWRSPDVAGWRRKICFRCGFCDLRFGPKMRFLRKDDLFEFFNLHMLAPEIESDQDLSITHQVELNLYKICYIIYNMKKLYFQFLAISPIGNFEWECRIQIFIITYIIFLLPKCWG